MISQEDLSLIYKYLDDDLSNEEVDLFKEKFESSQAFAKEVKRYTDLKVAIQTTSATSLKFKKQPRVIKFTLTRLAYAASVLIIIGLCTFFIYTNTQHPSYHQLYAANFENPFSKGEEWAIRSGLTEAEIIALKDFEQALTFMENKEFPKAIEILESFKDTGHALIIDDAEWFLALAYLYQGKVVKAKELLELVQSSNSRYSEKAWKVYGAIND